MSLINAKTPATMGEICDLSAYVGLKYESSIPWRVSCDFCLEWQDYLPMQTLSVTSRVVNGSPHAWLRSKCRRRGEVCNKQEPFNQMKR